MLVSAGQLPQQQTETMPSLLGQDQLESRAAEAKRVTEGNEIGTNHNQAAPPSGPSSMEAPEALNDGVQNQTDDPAKAQIAESSETDEITPGAPFLKAGGIDPSGSLPDEVLRAARAAPRLVPQFSKEENIVIEDGRLAEEGMDGAPKAVGDVR